ncbi:MAG: hypothetical protein HKN40_11325 [Winogradskyella sp.]|uniref:hypothetical protein n=1 Tax=Winogradskyella sp. TaxID=1883156 RepID=UPI0018204BBA|nr:hypothetical protein [Winogradskyella sp.]
MKPISKATLPCAVFGHNYEKTYNYRNNTSTLKCMHCQLVADTDEEGNFIETRMPNKDIQITLRKLYHLKLRTFRTAFSI